MQIAIVPAGTWGTALAVPATDGGHDVRLWRRTSGWERTWDRGHPQLPGLRLPPTARACQDAAEAVEGADLVILGAASVALRETCRAIRPHLNPDSVILTVTKGLEPDTHLRMTEVVEAELPEWRGRVTALSGPNFAHEVAAGLPTATVIACQDVSVAEFAQDALMTPRFRVYTNPDLVGVELGGALKNVIALGVGIADGLGTGDNARSALITRGLHEMGRLGKAAGANVLTFAGLAGMGDLVLTCTSDSSRNRRAGLAIGRGQSAPQFLDETHLTVEGIRTTRAAWTMAQKLNVVMPITETIHQILYEGLTPQEGTRQLMGRQPTHEGEETIRI